MGVIQGDTGVGAHVSLSVVGGDGKMSHVVAGAHVGDRVTICRDMAYLPSADASASFESAISVAGQLQQVSGDLKDHTIGIVLTRPT